MKICGPYAGMQLFCQLLAGTAIKNLEKWNDSACCDMTLTQASSHI